MQKWTVLPADIALQCPAWASDETRQLAAEVAEAFNTTKAARAESDRLRLAVGDVDPMTTSVSDLTGAAATARQSQLECLRTEIIARARFGEYLEVLERDRRRVERESADAVNQARADAKQRLLDSGVHDLSVAVTSGGKPDHDLRNAWGMVLNSGCPAVGQASGTYRECRSLMPLVQERRSHNGQARAAVESSLRKMLKTMATAAVA